VTARVASCGQPSGPIELQAPTTHSVRRPVAARPLGPSRCVASTFFQSFQFVPQSPAKPKARQPKPERAPLLPMGRESGTHTPRASIHRPPKAAETTRWLLYYISSSDLPVGWPPARSCVQVDPEDCRRVLHSCVFHHPRTRAPLAGPRGWARRRACAQVYLLFRASRTAAASCSRRTLRHTHKHNEPPAFYLLFSHTLDHKKGPNEKQREEKVQLGGDGRAAKKGGPFHFQTIHLAERGPSGPCAATLASSRLVLFGRQMYLCVRGWKFRKRPKVINRIACSRQCVLEGESAAREE